MAEHRETYTVPGMTCEPCVRAVRDEVAAVDGVSVVQVELEGGQVTVTSDRPLDRAAVAAAVAEAG